MKFESFHDVLLYCGNVHKDLKTLKLFKACALTPSLSNIQTPPHQTRGGRRRPLSTSRYHRKCITNQQNKKKTITPPQNIHLSCFALLSTILIVSPLTPNVFATLYSRRCVPFNISRCCPRSPSTARPRSRNSSSWAFVLEKKDCSRRAWFSRV